MFTSMSLACAHCVHYTDIMRANSAFPAFLPFLAAACLIGAAPSASIAADASPWDNDLQSAARLIAARAKAVAGERVLRAGVEIKLKPGWKTYWRYPGDSGVPPVLDFSKSENVKSVTVLYPAPTSFADGGGGNSIGYKGGVILPLHVVTRDAAKPAMLRLKLNYAACEKLCVPAHAALALALTGGDSAQQVAVDAAEARVPKRAEIGAPGVPSILTVRRQSGPGKPRVVVDVAAPEGAAVALFAEGPTLEWALPLPQPITGAPAGAQRFAFELDGLPPGAKADGAVLRFTAVAGEKAVEVAFRLD
jgi:DsbC/DsbD-like thiol-disulfide interchange protein